jgi:cellulose synthase/poly-beta-1,6-N-acetylglucosamine synthase-like glycosyltransferase
MPTLSLILASLSWGIWVYLLAGRGGYWRVLRFDADGDAAEAPREWPAVVAVVPARNEAENVAQTIRALLQQDYPGQLSIVLVDDHSEDGTAEVARQAAREYGGAARVRVHAAAAQSHRRASTGSRMRTSPLHRRPCGAWSAARSAMLWIWPRSWFSCRPGRFPSAR